MRNGISADGIGFKVYSQTRVSIPGKRNTVMDDTYVFSELKISTSFLSISEFIFLKYIDYGVIIVVEMMQILGLKLDMSTDKILL